MVTPILPFLKRDGYHVTLDIIKRGEPIFRNNPYVDKIHYHDESIDIKDLHEHWEDFGSRYDKHVNLTGSIEDGLLYSEHDRIRFNRSHEQRHAECNVNYYDRTMETAGYPVKGMRGELYFSPIEHAEARKIRNAYKNNFLIIWSLSGSSYHKTYPNAENVARAFCEAHPDAFVVTVGDATCMLLEWEHKNTIKKSDIWSLRRSMIMSKYADLVISTETGILNAAGCFDTPKIALLSHSSEENLTKNFKNCVSLRANVDCQPCHRLIYTKDACPLDETMKSPVCMAHISPATLLNAMEDRYEEWKANKPVKKGKNNGTLCGSREQAGVCA